MKWKNKMIKGEREKGKEKISRKKKEKEVMRREGTGKKENGYGE